MEYLKECLIYFQEMDVQQPKLFRLHRKRHHSQICFWNEPQIVQKFSQTKSDFLFLESEDG